VKTTSGAIAGAVLIPIVKLDACETNGRGRADAAGMDELTDSIRAHGIIQPLIVRRLGLSGTVERLEVVCGHRRLEAARRAGLLDVPVIERELTDVEAAEIQLVENLQREDLSPLDEASAIERLLTLVSLEEAAATLGKSRTYLASRMILTRLPQGARLALEAGTLSLSVALMIARVHDEALREKVALEVQDGRQVWDPDADEAVHVPLSIAETRRAFERTMLHLAHATFEPEDAELLPGTLACSLCPKRSGNSPDLFGDVSDRDVCTDPACFAQKRDAGWTTRKAEAEAKGYQVLPDSRAKKILQSPFNGSSSLVREDSGFVSPASKVGRDGDARQWLQVAKAAKVKPLTLAVRDPLTDKAVLLWRVDDLMEMLPADEKAKVALPKARAGSPATEPVDSPAAVPDVDAVMAEAAPQLAEAVYRAAADLEPEAFLRLLVNVSVPAYHTLRHLETIGMKVKKVPAQIDAQGCQAILALDTHEYGDSEVVEKALKINVKPILAAARKRLLEAQGEAAAPAKGKKAKAKR
jgi:ParB/RepB/Spo0J family partition protein